MTDQTKQKLKYWLFGLFTGGAVAAPVTAFVCKNIYDRKIAEASNISYDKGMNDMAEYAVQQQQEPKNEPEKEDKPLTEEDYADPRTYDTSLDGEEADLNEEAEERTVTHQRYLDMIGKYNGEDVVSPRIIDEDKYNFEMDFTKSRVNWYEEDNVFEEELNVIEDPFYTFGVTDGKELFKNTELRDDPDICYVRNERDTTDYEISRIHGSYARMVGGEVNLGEANT